MKGLHIPKLQNILLFLTIIVVKDCRVKAVTKLKFKLRFLVLGAVTKVNPIANPLEIETNSPRTPVYSHRRPDKVLNNDPSPRS